ncbi:ABC transporter permease [Arhodomonas sp. AD133]|uniref:ABC transporter permease n=1 Tax=Arhodomonas sp. AD133 TaxID=3415009 RepID=UPI003EBF3DB1
MRIADYLRLTWRTVVALRLRSALTALGIAIGIAAVILLTSIGEGLNRFVLAEFSQFGTNIIAVNPGRQSTHGASIGIFGTVSPLTIDDAEALRRIPGVRASMGVIQGNAEVESGRRARRTMVLGVGAEMPAVFSFAPAIGRFLPPDDPTTARPLAVLGSKVHEELFGARDALGERIRIAGSRFRVVGVMASKGQILGFDMDDAVYIPTARALELFNRDGVMEIDVLYREGRSAREVAEAVAAVLTARHGRRDFTMTTQEEMLSTLGSVLDVLTFAVGALGAISLAVGAVGILTIMTIAVRERTAEVGLLRALGASRGQVMMLFLGEAVVLATLGGATGLALGAAGGQLLRVVVPGLPVHTPWEFAVAAIAVAGLIGLIAGAWPARRAADLDPIDALRAE